jgi:diguanylate cyclase (GGDEF)-like protein
LTKSIIFYVMVPIFVLIIMASSIKTGKAASETLLVLSGVLFVLSIYLEKWYPRFNYAQLVLLATIQWSTDVNSCLLLYALLLLKEVTRMDGLRKSILLSSLFFSVYTVIRMLKYDISSQFLVKVVPDILVFLTIILVVQLIKDSEKEKQKLQQQNNQLVKYDPLTGLFNFYEFHNQLDRLLQDQRKSVLILIDCEDLKSLYRERGFENINANLKNISELLQTHFPEALAIARYGGHEFAVVIPWESSSEEIYRNLEIEMTQLTGIQLCVSHVVYPDEGEFKDSLISAAEKKVFNIKRERWLKREEHLFRSEKLKLVGELAAGMAHEIRNPLTAVKGFVQMSKDRQYNIASYYQTIMSEITRMSELTAEFLQFSKPHMTQYKLYAVQECVERAIQLTESEAVRLGHQIHYEHDSLPIIVNMDKDKMVQVLINLIKNSCEAMMQDGSVSIRLIKDRSYAVIEVKDTGKGIPEAYIDQIFNPFYTTKENGTGLGLSISHKIIQDHGGMMQVESSLNEGTLFRILLPAND